MPTDDGGLGEARARASERASRARLERATEAAYEDQAVAAYLDAVNAALAEQDARMSKAIPAFLEAAREIPPNAEVYVRVQVRRLFNTRYDSECRPEGHRVLQEGKTLGDNEFEHQSIVVTLEGVVRFRQVYPRHLARRAPFDPRWRSAIELEEHTDAFGQGWYERTAAAKLGALPFFITGRRTPLGNTGIRPLSAASTEPGELPARIEQTTPWFLDLLAAYLDKPAEPARSH